MKGPLWSKKPLVVTFRTLLVPEDGLKLKIGLTRRGVDVNDEAGDTDVATDDGVLLAPDDRCNIAGLFFWFFVKISFSLICIFMRRSRSFVSSAFLASMFTLTLATWCDARLNLSACLWNCKMNLQIDESEHTTHVASIKLHKTGLLLLLKLHGFDRHLQGFIGWLEVGLHLAGKLGRKVRLLKCYLRNFQLPSANQRAPRLCCRSGTSSRLLFSELLLRIPELRSLQLDSPVFRKQTMQSTCWQLNR